MVILIVLSDRSRYIGIVLSMTDQYIYGNCFVWDRSRYMGIVMSVTDQDIWGLFCL